MQMMVSSPHLKTRIEVSPFLPSAVAVPPCPIPTSCSFSSDVVRRGRSYGRQLSLRCQRPGKDGALLGTEKEAEEENDGSSREVFLNSFSPLPLLFLAALPGAETVKSVFAPVIPIIRSLNLPDWLVHWGHPGNMAVVLFAMGGYGTYLGFRIKFFDDVEEKAKAKDLHPKLLAGMFFLFALGATGGITSLLTSDKPILESPHAVTGLIGLALLTIQTILPSLFEGNPGLRNVHGILGSGIMTLFLVHFAFGLPTWSQLLNSI